MKSHAVTVLVLAAALPACTVGPGDVATQPDLPERWPGGTDGAGTFGRSARAGWWTEFRDPILDDLIARAIDGNLDLKVAAARVREARAARGIAASAALPQAGVYADAARSERSDAVPPFNLPNSS